MKSKRLLAFCLLALTLVVKAQTPDMMGIQHNITVESDKLTNGYETYVRGENLAYNNFWNRKSDAFLTRANNGKNEIEWLSGKVTKAVDGMVNYLFLVGIDQGSESVNFQLSIDGKYIFDFKNLPLAQWEQSAPCGVKMNFTRYKQTAWKDGFGFMTISVPQSMVKMGEPTRFKICGEKAESNIWFMVFRNTNLLEEIAHRAATDEYYKVEVGEKSITVSVPEYLKGTEVSAIMKGTEVKSRFAAKGNLAQITLPLGATSDTSLELRSAGRQLFRVENIFAQKSVNTLSGETLTCINVADNKIEITRQYSNSIEKLKELSGSFYNNSKVHVMVSSHQDIAWMDSPFQCIEDRDRLIVSPALKLLEENVDYRYDIEDALILKEYLERHPEKRAQIGKFIANGQLGIGASYTQPYEESQTGEALVRQFYFGKRWVEKSFPGVSHRSYWNVDVPGRTLQMPQILKKSGVDFLMYSRHEIGLYKWFAPDGSNVLTFTPGHYTSASHFLHKDPEIVVDNFIEYMEKFPDYRNDKSQQVVVGMLSAEDMSEARTYYNWIEAMKKFAKELNSPMPQIVHSKADMFMSDVAKLDATLPEIHGERPDLWQYIHAPSHQWAFQAYENANKDIIAAEMFSTVGALIEKSYDNYPTDRINQAWEAIIYPDHGWGGNKGHITDSLFLAKYRFAENMASRLKNEAITEISKNIRFDQKKGIPIVVYNSLSWQRSAPVSIALERSVVDGNAVLTDCEGTPVEMQIVPTADNKAELRFTAMNVPPIGYKTYYISKAKKLSKQSAKINPLENPFYEIVFNNYKIEQIRDKELNEDIFDTSKFEIGEVICMRSVGNGAGEFSTMQKPSMEFYESTSGKGAKWEIEAQGDVYTTLRSAVDFKEAKVIRRVKIYHALKRIDFDTEVLNFTGANYLEFRQMFPMKSRMEVSYNVPFGAVTVGRDEMKGAPGERYMDEAKDLHQRTVTDWIGAKDDKMSVRITTGIRLVDYIDPTDNPTDKTILQSTLFASRRSCHPQGEFYSQRGDHRFNFSLTSGSSADELATNRNAVSANVPLTGVVNSRSYTNARLAETASFFKTDDENIVISTVKKAEDDNDIVIRIYDTAGRKKAFTLGSLFRLDQLQKVDLLENNGKKVDSEALMIGVKSIETYKMKAE